MPQRPDNRRGHQRLPEDEDIELAEIGDQHRSPSRTSSTQHMIPGHLHDNLHPRRHKRRFSTFVQFLLGVVVAMMLCGWPFGLFVLVQGNGLGSLARHLTGPPIADCTMEGNPCCSPDTMPRVAAHDVPSLLLKGGTVWLPDDTISPNTDLLLVDGRIAEIGHEITPPSSNTILLDVSGKHVTPGIVDMHSHLGVYPLPGVDANSNGNEMTNPTLPQVRAMDALDPEDPAIVSIRDGGVTTSQVIPGSGNVMGGEGVMVKMVPGTVDGMVIKNTKRVLKMACGENPKRVYGKRGKMPSTRMGSAWLMRKKLEEARNMMRNQDAFCYMNPNPLKLEEGPWYPEEIALDSLVQLLRGHTVLNVHCYEVHDLEMMIRLSKEFNFHISAFHHGLEAYKLADLMKNENIAVATFAAEWGFKWEAFDASVHAPKILHAAGAKLVLKSDHPVTHAKDLSYMAGIAHHFGLPAPAAIAALTRTPADVLGLGHKTGSLTEGLDADVVVWDRPPLDLGAVADKVILEGSIVKDLSLNAVPPIGAAMAEMKVSIGSGYEYDLNAPVHRMSASREFVFRAPLVHQGGDLPDIHNGYIVVRDGMVTCVGTSLDCMMFGSPAPDADLSLEGSTGAIAPGFIASGRHSLGLMEVGAESQMKDGSAWGSMHQEAMITARDGLKMHERHTQAAFGGGVLLSVTPPMANWDLFQGRSVAFSVVPEQVLKDEHVLSDEVALHAMVGNLVKSDGLAGSISGQFSRLREAFLTEEPGSPLNRTCQGELPFVVRAQVAEEILGIIRLKREICPKMKLVIEGATDAYLVAEELAEADVSVILSPVEPTPEEYEDRRVVSDHAVRLHNAGVKFAIGMDDTNRLRDLRWHVGRQITKGLPFDVGLRAITTNVASILGLGHCAGFIKAGCPAQFSGWSHDPFTFQGHHLYAVSKGAIYHKPQQF